MFHRTRAFLAVLLVVASLAAACTPEDLVIGCSLVQGSITAPAEILDILPPGALDEAIFQVQDSSGNVLGSGNVQVAAVSGDTAVFSLSIPLNPAQAEGTFLLLVAEGGLPVASGPCTAGGQSAAQVALPTFFNPGDGRVAPQPWDRLAIYCHQPPGSLDVWGIDGESKGTRLATFTFDELAAAGLAGLSVAVDPNGTLSVSMDDQGNLWAAWNGGAVGADGQPDHGFAKGFRCD